MIRSSTVVMYRLDKTTHAQSGKGYDVIRRYSRHSFHAHGPRTCWFDGLGAEQAPKYYGNECNVMAEVVLSRYEFYIAFNMRTHLSANLSASESTHVWATSMEPQAENV